MPKQLTLSALFVVLLLTLAAIGVRAREHLRGTGSQASPAPEAAVAPAITAPLPPPMATVRETVPPLLPAAMPAAHQARQALDESALMEQLREMRQSDPELSLRLARQGNEQFPTSPEAAERAAIVVKSLMRMGRADEATAEARAMVDEYPGTPWAIDVRRHMLDVPSYDP
jgi:hypothetical protein